MLWRSIVHDWDKLLPSRWNAYANFFYTERTPAVKKAFMASWRGHANTNDHHWQHWVAISDKGVMTPHEMPYKARLEMLADWISAHRAVGGTDLYAWYQERAATIPLAPETQKWIENELTKGAV
jgi:hypothetical protein